MELKKIGLRIQDARHSRNITQDVLAQQTGLSTKYISNIECGYKLPRLETFIRIANTLDIDANSLLVDVLNVAPQISGSIISNKLSSLPLAEQNKLLQIFDLMIEAVQNQ